MTSPRTAAPDAAAALLDAARAGEAAARDELVSRHLDAVRAVCGRRLSSPDDVNDAVQETFARALAHLGQVREPDAVGPWLKAIAARVCTDVHRGRRWTIDVPATELERSSDAPCPQELAVASDEAARLHATLATLAPRDRRALWLRDAVGLPVASVAADLGVTEGSARVLLSRARTRVRAAYQGLAGVVGLGWLRLRGRTGPAGAGDPGLLRVLAAAQVAVAVAAVVAVVPDGGPHASGDEPRPAAPVTRIASDPASGAGAASADAGLHRDASVAPVVGAPSAAGGTDAPAAPPRPPLVELSDEAPEEPSRFGVAASDDRGDVATFEVWGLVRPDGEPDTSTEEPGDEDTDGDTDEDGIAIGPVELAPGDLGSRLRRLP